MDYQNPRQGLSGSQKTGFVLLLVFGVLAVGMGVLQMRNNIFSPFVLRVSKSNLEEASLFQDETTRLQSIDTDRDGLNDYEELNFYETSPYLPDTDSDGIDDKTEIEKGADPLCPVGEQCGVAEAIPASSSTIDIGPAEMKTNVQPANFLSSLAPQESNVDIGAEIQKWSKDPAELRALLVATGNITQEQLDKIDDATLVKLLQSSVLEHGGAQFVAGAGGVSVTTSAVLSTSTNKQSN